MGWRGWPRLSGWGLSRRAIATVFGSLTLLSSRPGLNLLAAAGDMAEIAITGAVAYQLAVGGAVIGLHVAWGFIGYLVYAYIPELYPEKFGGIVEERRFRATTAALTVYFGVALSRSAGVVPDAGVFALFPDQAGGPIAVVVGGFLAGTFVFSGYISVWRRERSFVEDTFYPEVWEWFSVRSPREQYRQLQTLSSPVGKLGRVVEKSFTGSIYVLPCVAIGSVMAFVNVFYPIPEALILGGIVVSYPPVRGRLRAILPVNFEYDIEYRLADEATDTIQNMKGFVLAMLILTGLSYCASVYFQSVGLLGTVGAFFTEVEEILTAVHSYGRPANWPIVDVAWSLGFLWVLFGLVLLGAIYSLYGLLYWFQQLKRLPRYVDYWEKYWKGDVKTLPPPAASVRRPPGLFLPGGALLIVWGGLIWVARAAEPELTEPGLVVVWGLGLAWPAVVGIVGWSVYTTTHGEPQSLAHEGRDIFLALTIQWLTLFVVMRQTGSIPLEYLTSVVLYGGLTYAPDVSVYSERQDSLAALLDIPYWCLLVVIVLALVDVKASVPKVLYGVILVTFGIVAMTKMMIQYTENRGSTSGD